MYSWQDTIAKFEIDGVSKKLIAMARQQGKSQAVFNLMIEEYYSAKLLGTSMPHLFIPTHDGKDTINLYKIYE